MYGTLLRRWSHVGRRPITLHELASIDVLPAAGGRADFGKTHIEQLIRLRGPLGTADIPLHHGLVLRAEPGLLPGEKILRVSPDPVAIKSMSKYCKKFVRSMWGTTNSLLRQHVEGITEVCAARAFSFLTHIDRDFKFLCD